MSMCYSVSLHAKIKDEKNAVKMMQNLLKQKDVDYGIAENKARGIGTDTFDDLIRIFLSSCDMAPVSVTRLSNEVFFDTDFNASYGWENVMVVMFEKIAPFLEDDSTLVIDMDSDYDQLVVRNNAMVQLH